MDSAALSGQNKDVQVACQMIETIQYIWCTYLV